MKNDVVGRIHSVETFGAVDGPGIRYVAFLQGCPLRCLYCHNPDSWDPAGGRETTVGEMMRDINKYRNFIKSGGVTLSGGEPLYQPAFAQALLEACREAGFHTALDTSGAVPLRVSAPVVDAADMLLLDIKAIDTALAKRLSGAGNENAIDMLRYCEEKEKPVWIRHVLVPGWTLDHEQAHRLGQFLKDFQCVRRVELLGFHKMGEFKWETLCLDYQLADTPSPSKEQVREIKDILRSYGLQA